MAGASNLNSALLDQRQWESTWFGIASLQTFLSKREQFHSNILTNSVSVFEEATRARVAQLTAYFMSHGVSDQATATHKAVIAIALKLRKQANIMALWSPACCSKSPANSPAVALTERPPNQRLIR